MITRRNLLKAFGLSGLALATRNTIADIFLSSKITRNNPDETKAKILKVYPVQIQLIDNARLSGIKFITPNNYEVTFGVFSYNNRLYLVENPTEKIEKRNGKVVIKPFKSRIISLEEATSAYGMKSPIEVPFGSTIIPVEIKVSESKIEGLPNQIPSFTMDSREYCIARAEGGVYHLIETPNMAISDGKDATIIGSRSYYLGNLEAKVKP